ncbi:MAG: NAD(P)-dependent oxidoreductase [Rhodocyclaceae bacterium]|nr:NAD(P)-dependent oxidoreductase [Rhodocyclaceae bacterium]
MKIAFIGLGNMGSGMASCIQKAGYDLTVWNRTGAKADLLVTMGAKRAASARDAVIDADLVITSLMDDQSILDMVGGEGGILDAMKPWAVHLCVTTISPNCADALAKRHREHGTHYVSGPVIGRPDAAATVQLETYLAGEAGAITLAKPVCESYAKMVIVISERPSIANSMKLCINYAGISIIEIIGETYAFGEKSGVDLNHLQQFFQMIIAHPAMKMYAEKARIRDFNAEAGFAMSAGLKDVRLMLASAGEAGVALEIGRIIERKMLAAISSGLESADWSAICEVTRRESGLGQ